jgi:transposase, IS30 family
MGIRMEVSKIPKGKNLTKSERILIAQWINKGKSNKWIAGELAKDISTIGREITRNSVSRTNADGKVIMVYEPLHAHAKSLRRREKAWKAKHPLKNKKVFSYTIDHLRSGWSPEQISGRLKEKYPDDKSWHICAESVYRFIYSVKQKDKEYWEYLRRKQKRRRIKGGRKSRKVRIPDRVSIHQRPKEVEERKVAGHYEGDSVVGKGKTNGLHTEYERVTSMIFIRKLKAVNSKETVKAMKRIFDPMPYSLKKSITLDNGTENAKHKKVGIDTYFADPYSAYQRGGNENGNLWIRYYFPKGTDFSKITDEEIKEVQWELNNRPRKRLGFKKPIEVWNELLKG